MPSASILVTCWRLWHCKPHFGAWPQSWWCSWPQLVLIVATLSVNTATLSPTVRSLLHTDAFMNSVQPALQPSFARLNYDALPERCVDGKTEFGCMPALSFGLRASENEHASLLTLTRPVAEAVAIVNWGRRDVGPRLNCSQLLPFSQPWKGPRKGEGVNRNLWATTPRGTRQIGLWTI